MTAKDLLNRMNDRPFKPFRIHLSGDTHIDVTEPGMVIVGLTSAVLPSAWEVNEDGDRLAKRWQTVDVRHMIRFSDIEDADQEGSDQRAAG